MCADHAVCPYAPPELLACLLSALGLTPVDCIAGPLPQLPVGLASGATGRRWEGRRKVSLQFILSASSLSCDSGVVVPLNPQPCRMQDRVASCCCWSLSHFLVSLSLPTLLKIISLFFRLLLSVLGH